MAGGKGLCRAASSPAGGGVWHTWSTENTAGTVVFGNRCPSCTTVLLSGMFLFEINFSKGFFCLRSINACIAFPTEDASFGFGLKWGQAIAYGLPSPPPPTL